MRNSNNHFHKHELYQFSVQSPEFETKFLQRVYRQLRDQEPRKLREDFCGTALLSCEWVRRVKEGEAQGLDLDLPTLRWGTTHNVAPLGSRRKRVKLLNRNVLLASGFSPDIVVAFNFSYFVFKTRDLLLQYFSRVHRTLAHGGIFVIDIYGGLEAQRAQEESTDQDEGFTYVWDQTHYNPITGDYLCDIHFDFPDGTRMKKAFTYDWRLWHLPEVVEILRDAGFRDPVVYWEGTDNDTGGGNGVFRRSIRGDDSISWIAYIAALK